MKSISLLVAMFGVSSLVSGQSAPDLKIPSSFKAVGSLSTWDGSKLLQFYGENGTILVDSKKNKVMLHAIIDLPVHGPSKTSVLIDFTTGESLTHVPSQKICSSNQIDDTVELAKEIAKVNDKSSKVTKYLGQIYAPWDKSSPTHKFTSRDTVNDHDLEAETYYEQSNMALKWISFLQTDTKKHFVVGIAKGGLQPTTFTDADFELVGCALGDSDDDTEDADDFEEEEDEEDLEDLEDLEDFEEEEDLEELDEEDFDDDEEIEEEDPEEEEEFDFEDDEEETADDDDEEIEDEEEIDDDPIDDDFSDEDEPS
jgi:hypothetical protein